VRKDYKDSPKFRDKKSRGGGSTSVPPGWLWMAVGLLVGLFVAFLVYVNTRVPDEAVDASKKEAPPQAKPTAVAPKEPPKVEEDKPKLGFYSELPKRKVEIKDDPPLAQPPPNTPIKAGPTLQVGSFHRFEDADKRKANLALLGIASHIEHVPVAGGKLYRVVVGPYTDRKEAESTRVFLAKNNIEAVLQR